MSESDAEMDSSLGILSPSDMKTSGIMSMTASQASNQGTIITLQNYSRNTIHIFFEQIFGKKSTEF